MTQDAQPIDCWDHTCVREVKSPNALLLLSGTCWRRSEKKSMASQNPPTAHQKKLTGNESELRRREKERGIAQWYIDQVLQLKQHYQFRLHKILAIVNRHKPFPLPDTDPHCVLPTQVSQRENQFQPWTKEEWEEMYTLLLLPTPDIALTKAQHAIFPDTGDIELSSIIPKRSERTTSHGEIRISSQAVNDLIAACQEQIRNFYHAQQPKHMPQTIKLGKLNYLALCLCCDVERHHEPGSEEKYIHYFPQTNKKVLVEVDDTAGNAIICE